MDRKWEELDPGGFLQSRQQLFEGRQAVLDQILGDALIDQEAAARGLTEDKLLEQEIAARLKPVTEQEIQAVYQANQARLQGATLDQARDRTRTFLQQSKPDEARQAFVNELRAKSTTLKVMLSGPNVRVALSDTDPVRGPAMAPVQIIKFSDFQCPFCGRVTPTLDKLRGAFGDQLSFVFKDFPLPNHPQAPKAAEAAQCARVQNKFWEFHDRLFAQQQALDVQALKKHAADLGLETEKFDQCLDSGQMATFVQNDMDEGRRYGVSSTAVVVLHQRSAGARAQPYEVSRRWREELARKGKN